MSNFGSPTSKDIKVLQIPSGFRGRYGEPDMPQPPEKSATMNEVNINDPKLAESKRATLNRSFEETELDRWEQTQKGQYPNAGMFCAWPPVCFEEGLVQQRQLERLRYGPETPLTLSESVHGDGPKVHNEGPATMRPSVSLHPDCSQRLQSLSAKGLPSTIRLAKHPRPEQQVDEVISKSGSVSHESGPVIDQLSASNKKSPFEAAQSSSTVWTALTAATSPHTRSCSTTSTSPAEAILTPSTEAEGGSVTLPDVVHEANLEAWTITVDGIPTCPKFVEYNQQKLPFGQDTIRLECRSWASVWEKMEQLKPRLRNNVMSLCLTLDAQILALQTFDKNIEVDYGTLRIQCAYVVVRPSQRQLDTKAPEPRQVFQKESLSPKGEGSHFSYEEKLASAQRTANPQPAELRRASLTTFVLNEQQDDSPTPESEVENLVEAQLGHQPESQKSLDPSAKTIGKRRSATSATPRVSFGTVVDPSNWSPLPKTFACGSNGPFGISANRAGALQGTIAPSAASESPFGTVKRTSVFRGPFSPRPSVAPHATVSRSAFGPTNITEHTSGLSAFRTVPKNVDLGKPPQKP